MALRPSQIRASACDGALMIPGAVANAPHYAALAMPVVIMAGAEDKVVLARSARRLHAGIPGSVLQMVEHAGHMLHHAVPDHVAAMIERVAAEGRPAGLAAEPMPPARLAAA
jgi:pimeloyl-ACP methyl ester carboxylesterase